MVSSIANKKTEHKHALDIKKIITKGIHFKSNITFWLDISFKVFEKKATLSRMYIVLCFPNVTYCFHLPAACMTFI